MKISRETEVLGENLPQRHFVHHKSHMTKPGLEPRGAAVGSQQLTAWAMAWPFTRVRAKKRNKIYKRESTLQDQSHLTHKVNLQGGSPLRRLRVVI
jgi:hypothetical protein